MKKLGLLLVLFATLATTSCSLLTSSATTQAGAVGVNTSKALMSLYNSKQTNGQVSITNSSDLSNMLIVLNASQQLRANQADPEYKTNFIAGMVRGGSGMITTASATTIVNSLLSNTAFAGVNAQNIAQKAETVSAIITLLNALK